MSKLLSALLVSATFAFPLAVSGPARADNHEINACGCYTQAGACFCEKKAKCGCPGECEPKGCEEDRQKQLQKEIEEETKRAKELEKAQAAKPKEEGKAADEADSDDKGGAASKKDAQAHGSKAARKLTAAQKKQLSKLLDSYLAEHPDAVDRTLNEVRDELQPDQKQ